MWAQSTLWALVHLHIESTRFRVSTKSEVLLGRVRVRLGRGCAVAVDHVGEGAFVAESNLVNKVDESADNKTCGAFQPESLR